MASASRQAVRIDLVAFDRQGQPVLRVEVKAMAGASEIGLPWLIELASDFQSTGFPIPYCMFVDLDVIHILKLPSIESPASTFTFKTADILKAYEPEFEAKRIFEDYLSALVEAWLRDFAFDWRAANPPCMKELTDIGLADRLKGGMTYREVSLANLSRDPLRGNQLPDESFPGTGLGDLRNCSPT